MRHLANNEDGRKFMRWVGEKFLRSGEFSGVFLEREEGKVLELLIYIVNDAKGVECKKFLTLGREGE